MEEEDKKDVTEETKDMEDEATKEGEEIVYPGDVGALEDVLDPKDEDIGPEEDPLEPVVKKETKEDPDKAKIAKLKAGIESSVKRGVRAGQSRYLARSLAYIEARRKALKTLGYIPKGFYKDKD